MPKQAPKTTAIDKKLRAARDNVRNYTFGTDEWEAAMVIVRRLADEANSMMPKFEYTSIDGDIFDRVN